MRNRYKLWIGAVALLIVAAGEAKAERDWEYWSRYSLSAPLYSNVVSLVMKPEWRFRNDMADTYLIKPEAGVALKVNPCFEITPCYVWQKSLASNGWDRSDVSYLDATLKVPLDQSGNLKVSDRLRHEYNWDKETTIWRNSLRLSRTFKLAQCNLSPFVEDEVFYSEETDRITRNWASVGVAVAVGSHADLGVSYLLDTKKTTDDWIYANVLVTSLSLRF